MEASSVRRNMLWNAVGNMLYLGCQWIVTVLVTRIGGLTDAGVLSVAMSVSATFQTVAMFGIRNFQVSDVVGKYRDTGYVGFRTLTCLAALLLCLLFSLINGYLGGQLLAICLFMLFRLAEAYSDVLHGILQRNGRLDLAGKSFAGKAIGLLVCFLGGYWLSRDLNVGLFCMALFSCGVTVLFDLPAARRLSSFGLVDSFSHSMKLALETLPLCVYLFLSAALTTVPRLILEKQSGEDVLGAYASVAAPVLLLQAAAGYLYQPFMSFFAEYTEKKDAASFFRLLAKVTLALLGIFALVFVAAIFFGEFAMVLVFGEQIRAYIDLLFPLLAVNLLLAYLGLLSTVIVVLRRFRWLLIGHALGFLLCTVLTAPCILAFGTNGASYSLIIASVAASAVLMIDIGITFSRWKAGRDSSQAST